MAEKVKKTKAPAKPKATAATTKTTTATTRISAPKKQTVAEKVTATTPTHQEIAQLALHYWAERGRQHGQHEQDWLRAEQELLKMAS
jgi:Protein of unknown function (DUF2934)